MRLEVAERMRCPCPHAATPLIVVARRTLGRELVEGIAGCPVCRLEARIVAGHVVFPSGVGATGEHAFRATRPENEAVERLAALLGLAEPGGAVLLTGCYARLASGLFRSVEVNAVALNTPVQGEGGWAVMLAEPSVPFTDGSFRAAALDAAVPPPVVLDAVRAVAVGGRIVGALPLERPSTVRELARDGEEWVGERAREAAEVIAIRRA